MSSELKMVQDELRKTNIEIDSVKKILTPEKVKQFQDPTLHKFPEKDLKIRINQNITVDQSKKSNSNKDWIEFNISKPCWKDGPNFGWDDSFYPFLKLGIFEIKDGKKIGYNATNDNYVEAPELIAFINVIKETNMISGIINTSAFNFKLQKTAALSWEEVLPKVLEAIASLFPKVGKKENQPSES